VLRLMPSIVHDSIGGSADFSGTVISAPNCQRKPLLRHLINATHTCRAGPVGADPPTNNMYQPVGQHPANLGARLQRSSITPPKMRARLTNEV
jgi:hypothetical protein